MPKQNVILITGMSGAGKTSAMSVLEDLGFHCIDNYPVQLINQLDTIIGPEADETYKNLALATTAMDYPKFIAYLENLDVNLKVIFLDADDDELLLRYRFTRRHHPLMLENKALTLEEAIDVERDLFQNMKWNATIRIDTSKMETSGFKRVFKEHLGLSETDFFRVAFSSFGYKHGIPIDADVILDVRFLPNPFYDEELKEMTGNDKPVFDYVIEAQETVEYLKVLTNYLDYMLELYQGQLKNHVNICIGCTGGHHRSVSIVNWLYEYYNDTYKCFTFHRDLER